MTFLNLLNVELSISRYFIFLTQQQADEASTNGCYSVSHRNFQTHPKWCHQEEYVSPPKYRISCFQGAIILPLEMQPPLPPPPSHQIDREQLNSLVNKHVNTLHFCQWFFVSVSCHGLCLVLTWKGVVKYLHWVTLFHKQVHPDLIKPIPVVWALKTNYLTITNR